MFEVGGEVSGGTRNHTPNREATGKTGRRWRETPGTDRWAGGPPLIRAVPAPKSLRTVLYDPSAPVKVRNMDDLYSPRDLACAVRQTWRRLEQTSNWPLQLAEKSGRKYVWRSWQRR